MAEAPLTDPAAAWLARGVPRPESRPFPARDGAGLDGLCLAADRSREAADTLDHLICLLGVGQEGWHAEHVRRVVLQAERLAAALGLAPDEVRAVRWGAALHDIGKTRVPQAILQKTGPLDPLEYGVILQHPEWGVELLEGLPFLPQATREAVRSHHERWDGGGYPAGLRGDQIPLSARIVSLADVFDALTQRRPYKPAWTEQEAARSLLREAGRQFDPDLAPLFVEAVLGLGHLTALPSITGYPLF
ncbi:hypothetical protein DEIPH_ctg079orf0058 [Deinococcus phoenicis]|uniref:Uncharacterized protein n=1 Tax=Deinococcus phoenicis TaxID=1476583 RepID=A0A016QKJ4_9DEIO|nr:HD-GYP domain-containing protein [Deinococcus phoenicis]EYB66670.1 hypothetical protein DEIPH_ctg079orf0058 [Deinococcus phoenicis]